METMFTGAALCAVGAEKVVSNEIRKMGLPVIDGGYGRVRFKTGLAGLYRALMGLRAADRVLLETARFPAEDFDALFEGTRNVPWEAYIPRGMGLTVTKVRTNRSRLTAETSVQAVVHKAAAGRICERLRLARLPELGKRADLRVYIEKDLVSLLLDVSGAPLFKRGYRVEGGAAPLRETTAAALLLLANWRRKYPLWDPLCGAGTIVIEAALYAWDMAPGLGRSFAVQDMLLADPKAEQAVREELLARVDFNRTIRIYGSDADERALAFANANLRRAYGLAEGKAVPPLGAKPRGFQEGARRLRREERGPGLPLPEGPGSGPGLPDVRPAALEDAGKGWPPRGPYQSRRPGAAEGRRETTGEGRKPEGKERAGEPQGFIITNPPYGIRLGDTGAAEAVYRSMAEVSRKFPGWKLGIITDHPGFESHFGKKADACKEITNGAIRSYFYQYEPW
ncbi:MAG: class I SAM-dependent RNA methyltransferase [Treponema sp.]|jgi:putative N6-adenine-specific DNA methylase|nr:class I SAM-dependent RNA methyltransferase [Treponema sp.]